MNAFVARRLRLLSATLVLAAGGCTSTPIDFYFLEPLGPPPATGAFPATSLPSTTLVVDSVTLPEYLNRPDIVTQVAGTELNLSDVQQWAEDLDDGVARVLQDDLAYLLADHGIAVVPRAFADGDARLSVAVSRFEVTASNEAVIAAQWRLVRGEDGRRLLLRQSDHRRPVTGTGYGAITAALNDALHALSREIAAATAESLGRDAAPVRPASSPEG